MCCFRRCRSSRERRAHMMEQKMRVEFLVLLSLFSAGVARSEAGHSARPAERVGFREDFSSADGWVVRKWPGVTGMESITSNGRQSTFTTLAGTFMTGASAAWAPSWPDWDKNAPAGLAIIVKKYAVVVDLDQYHYLVARITHSGTYMALAVNGWDTKVCYTTGLHAVDLRDIPQPSLRGRQAIELRLTFLNTGARVTLDEVRLVDALSPEEQVGLIPAGLNLRLERRAPTPFHGLEALNDRAGAPVRFDLPEERTVFRDTSTGAKRERCCKSFTTSPRATRGTATRIRVSARTRPRSPTCATCWATPTSTSLSRGGRKLRGA